MSEHRSRAEALLADLEDNSVGPHLSKVPAPAVVGTTATTHAILALIEVIEESTSPLSLDDARAALGIGSPPDEPYHFTVYEEIRQARQKQYAEGWSFEHDQEHGLQHIDQLIEDYQSRKLGEHKTTRETFVIVAALAVAGIDLIDGKPSV
ncbi:hypothetical protein SEA_VALENTINIPUFF_33 [Microbacterium phage ValentiniPuff]|uniref:Uncharacterized protein n=1 Tax=Microbacterium phage ValentiniPuff TaxID=2315705 RepID=A0A386KSS0_9CAUD|nr:hypothetical protein SEA_VALENTINIPUFF_33 [Microbacterium phage ValentiniPuff]